MWDLDLNSISMINLVMAVGLVVDYSAPSEYRRGARKCHVELHLRCPYNIYIHNTVITIFICVYYV